MKRAQSIAVALLFACTASTGALANSEDGIAPAGAGTNRVGVGTQEVGADFGTGTNILQIPAAAFALRSGTYPNYVGAGYVQATASYAMWAPVVLPSGAHVSYVDIYYCDAGAGAITFFLTAYQGFNDATRTFTDIGSITTADVSGGNCAYDFVSVSHTINNNVRYGGGGQYVVNAQASSSGPSFKAVDLWWTRPIAPAPASASFTDVPTGHPFFQYIEALRTSGVTTGCTATAFCPDASVTRGQMAAFLARALGLGYGF